MTRRYRPPIPMSRRHYRIAAKAGPWTRPGYIQAEGEKTRCRAWTKQWKARQEESAA